VSSAAGWGTIKGKFVVDGDVAKPAAVDASKEAFCANHDPAPVNESVLVSDSGGLANVVVYLRPARGKAVEVHPDFDASKSEPVVLDNKGCSFHPHVVLVRTGQPLLIKNSDPVGHNTKTSLLKNANFNQTIPAGAELPFKLTKAEAIPLPVECSIHPFMKGFVLVKDDPYMIVSAADGTFEIKNVPAGSHEFEFWHEAAGRLKNLKHQGGALNRQGRAKLKVADGATLDMGDIKVPASSLK
jgi:plastocyanin